MASRAIEFYRKIESQGDRAAFISRLISIRTSESEFLEFKGGRIDENTLKKYWSQALSGFANTEGGVLVFGIRTDRIAIQSGSRGIDTAVDVDPVAAPTQLIQLLKDVQLQATIDPVQGVEWLPILISDGGGFVACLIPEGKNKPYRAELDPSRNYFQRVGDNFVHIPHSLLRSLFYPRAAPRLNIVLKVHFPNNSMISLRGDIRNVGAATARQIAAKITSDRPVQLGNNSAVFGGSSAGISGSTECRLFAHLDLHPGDEFSMFYAQWLLRDTPEPPHLIIAVYMADREPTCFRFQPRLDDLKQDQIFVLNPEDAVELNG